MTDLWLGSVFFNNFFTVISTTIIKNDYLCKYMGFAPTKVESERRAKAIEKYRNL